MLPYGKQLIDQDDIDAVVEVLKSDFLTTGPHVEKFEAELCKQTGAEYAVACSNGTAALHLAVLAHGLEEGEAAIVPTLTFLATANAVRYTNMPVIFSDVCPETGLITESCLQEAIDRAKVQNLKPKLLLPVHLAGQCADLEALKNICKANDMNMIADSCHAIGGSYKNYPVGSCAYENMATFSFHPVKTITSGEGGAITTNDAKAAERMRKLRSHGMRRMPEKNLWSYEMDELGYNYRLTDIQSALGLSQLKKLQTFIEKRQALVDLYDKLLQPLTPNLEVPCKVKECKPGWHLYPVQIDFNELGFDRNTLMVELKNRGIGTQVHYIPVHTQPYYQSLYGEINLPGADTYYSKTLSLPLFSSMEKQDVEFVVEMLQECFLLNELTRL